MQMVIKSRKIYQIRLRSVLGNGSNLGWTRRGAGASCHRGKLSLAIFGTTP